MLDWLGDAYYPECDNPECWMCQYHEAQAFSDWFCISYFRTDIAWFNLHEYCAYKGTERTKLLYGVMWEREFGREIDDIPF